LAQQLDTLVLTEHRGHRPGMLLKIANLRKPAAEHTAPALVYTFSRGESPHAGGQLSDRFGPVGHAGSWRKGS